MGGFLAIIPVLWTSKYTLHIFGRPNCSPRQRTQTTKGITKSLFQMSVRDIHSKQELLFIGTSEAQYIHIWKIFSLFVMCESVSLSINSPVMALGDLQGTKQSRGPRATGCRTWREEVVSGKKRTLILQYSVENLSTRRLWPHRSWESSFLLPKQLLRNQLHLYGTKEKGFS